jgi:hypothetical protein
MAQGALLLQRWVFSLLLLKGEMEKLNKIKNRDEEKASSNKKSKCVAIVQ